MISSKPTISVVIPAYKSADFIEETVDSVVSQEGVDFEVIVGIQGPDDGTKQVLKKYSKDSRVHIFESPKGAAKENWDFVTNKAKGRYIKLLPSDDLITAGTLERQYKLLENSNNAVLTAAKRSIIDEKNKVITKSWGLQNIANLPETEGKKIIKKISRLGMNSLGEPGGVLIRTESLKKANGWDFSNPYVVDLQTYVNVLVHGNFIPDNQIGSNFRVSQGQWTNTLSDSQAEHFINFIKHTQKITDGYVNNLDLFVGSIVAKTAQLARRIIYRIKKK